MYYVILVIKQIMFQISAKRMLIIINVFEVGPFRDLIKILNFWSKALERRSFPSRVVILSAKFVTYYGGVRTDD